jgi:hypothetical protein
MLALQRRAARAGIQLRAVTPEDDGALDVEISCSRPAL